jgi:hypothetical protein
LFDGHLFQRALQDGLEHAVGGVVLVEGQVVDEEDELLHAFPPESGLSMGQVLQLLLVHLDEPQVPRSRWTASSALAVADLPVPLSP